MKKNKNEETKQIRIRTSNRPQNTKTKIFSSTSNIFSQKHLNKGEKSSIFDKNSSFRSTSQSSTKMSKFYSVDLNNKLKGDDDMGGMINLFDKFTE